MKSQDDRIQELETSLLKVKERQVRVELYVYRGLIRRLLMSLRQLRQSSLTSSLNKWSEMNSGMFGQMDGPALKKVKEIFKVVWKLFREQHMPVERIQFIEPSSHHLLIGLEEDRLLHQEICFVQSEILP